MKKLSALVAALFSASTRLSVGPSALSAVLVSASLLSHEVIAREIDVDEFVGEIKAIEFAILHQQVLHAVLGDLAGEMVGRVPGGEPERRIELLTYALRVRCSTD